MTTSLSALTGVLLAAVLISPQETLAIAPDASTLPELVLERAPGELGSFRGKGLVLLAAGDDGEVLLLEGRRVRFYSEDSGELLDQLILSENGPGPLHRLRLDEGRLAVLGGNGLKVFSHEGNLLAAERIIQPLDVVRSKASYVVSLINTPIPGSPKRVLGRSSYQTGEGVPRVVRLGGHKLSFEGSGMFVRYEDLTPSKGAGRALFLASSGETVYAAEFSNYTLYELNRRLQLRRTLSEPEIVQDDLGDKSVETEAEMEAQLRDAKEILASRGEELGGSVSSRDREPSAPPVVIFFNNKPAIRDMAWEETTNRLLVLIQTGVVATGRPVLDVVDPTTGEAQRFVLEVSSKDESSLNQIAVGERYLWFRSKRGSGVVYRLSLLDLLTLEESNYQIPMVVEYGEPLETSPETPASAAAAMPVSNPTSASSPTASSS